MNIGPYQIESTIHHTSRSLVYRALDRHGNSVIVKTLLSTSGDQVVSYMQEYQIGRRLKEAGIYGACELQKQDDQLLLVLDDFGGEALNPLIPKLALPKALEIAIRVTEALGRIHQAGITHMDINPSNIIFHPASGRLEIIDFSASSLLPSEEPGLQQSLTHGGTLAYISPEQTGRMNRSLDYRTDYYAFGVTLYELFTGTLPFTTNDPLELIHCHIAREPVPLYKLNPKVPTALNDVVVKLLAKNPEDRYQSAQGIRYDLEQCLARLHSKENSPFATASRDLADHFQVSQRLYGRQEEVNTLVAAFERVAIGSNECVLIGGYSGCGKTALVREMYKPITKARGYFIEGKFDQLQREIPYSAVVQAFESLIRHYQSLPPAQLEDLSAELQQALGGYGQLIVDKLPELEKIIGPQPAVTDVGLAEAQNRFQLVFRQFLAACCRPDAPLTLFLDDLQWADQSSLALLEQLVGDQEIGHFFLIGAYRDNEVHTGHPLVFAIAEIRRRGGALREIPLGPLTFGDVRQMIADTLRLPTDEVSTLVELMVKKTGGNPFFVNQFLKMLHSEKVVHFDLQSNAWHYDIRRIIGMGISDNVVDLMLDKLRKLPEATTTLLSQASCIGNRFTLRTLATVSQTSLSQAWDQLQPAAALGLVQPLSKLEPASEAIDAPLIVNNHRFLHDRVQEAAYRLIPEDQRARVHLTIGQLMQASDPVFEEYSLFDVINHLNAGGNLIRKEQERVDMARLNLRAAKAARSSNAIDAALRYANTGLAFVPQDKKWSDCYPITLELMLLQSDFEVFNGQFEHAQAMFAELLEHAEDDVDRSKVYERQLQVFVSSNQMEKALKLTTRVLTGWGIPLKTDPTEEDWRQADRRFRQLRGNRTIAELLDVAPIDNPLMEAALRLLMNTLPASYQTRAKRPHCMISLMTVMMNIGLEHGYSDISAYAYSAYIYCITDQHRYEEAYAYGKLAMALNDRWGNAAITGKLLIYFSFYAQFWREHFNRCEGNWKASYTAALEAGDLIHVAFLFLNKTPLRFAQSVALEDVKEETLKAIEITRKANYPTMLYIIQLDFNLALNLLGETTTHLKLDSDELTEREYLDFMNQQNNSMGIAYYHAAKLVSNCYFGHYEQAFEHGEAFEQVMLCVPGMVVLAEHGFYFALALAERLPDADAAERVVLQQKFDHYADKARVWKENCPDNFLCRYQLIQAEKARLAGDHDTVIQAYADAAQSAREQGFLNIEALANERAARYWLQRGYPRYARAHLQGALISYELWGAHGRIDQLKQAFPELVQAQPSRNRASLPISVTDTSTLIETENLDLNALLRATQSISGEIVLDKLLHTLMTVVLESAGAESALLLHPNDSGNFRVDAMARTQAGQDGDDDAVENIQVSVRPADSDATQYPLSLVQYVAQSRNPVVLDDARSDTQFASSSYITQRQPLSVFCMPVIHQSNLKAVLYLENNLVTGAFSSDRITLLRVLCSQAAISLDNAGLYEQVHDYSRSLEQKVAERTAKLEELNSQLELMAHQDGLTNIANRRKLDEYFQHCWNSHQREKAPLAVIMADIDYFKVFNDTYGHQKGDDCLAAVAQAFQGNLKRSTDFVGRYGGEEFMVVLPHTDLEGAREVAETFRLAVMDLQVHHEHSPVKPYVTMSLGVASEVPDTVTSPQELINKADNCLYEAKEQGRNRVC